MAKVAEASKQECSKGSIFFTSRGDPRLCKISYIFDRPRLKRAVILYARPNTWRRLNAAEKVRVQMGVEDRGSKWR